MIVDLQFFYNIIYIFKSKLTKDVFEVSIGRAYFKVILSIGRSFVL